MKIKAFIIIDGDVNSAIIPHHKTKTKKKGKMKKLVNVGLIVIGLVISAKAQTPYNTNTQFANLGFLTGATLTGNVIVNSSSMPTVTLATGSTAVVTGVAGGGVGAGVYVFPGSCDNATVIAITNGNSHAWTNTTGYLILSNAFVTPRSGSNYVVNVNSWWYLTNNPMTYTPPGTIYATNQSTVGFNLAINNVVLTNVVPALPSTTVVGLNWTVFGQ